MLAGLRAGLALAFLLACWTPAWPQEPDNSKCAACHEQAQNLQKSAHASITCTTCHVGHETVPHPEGIPKPKCTQCHFQQASEFATSVHAMVSVKGSNTATTCANCHGDVHQLARTHTWEFKKGIPALCGQCHQNIVKQYQESIHGQALLRGVVDVAVCTTCHHEHLILAPTNPSSSVYPTHVRETCGQCHGNLRLAQVYGLPSDRLLTYDASFHGMLGREGSLLVANCASCHGFHDILPSSDPRSSINPNHLSKTCGRCHAGAGKRFAIGPVHELPGAGMGFGPESVAWVRLFYLIVIPLTIGYMFVHNLGDWVRKLIRARFRSPEPNVLGDTAAMGQGEIRMYGFERLEHLLLLSSFALLVWTGFALKYPGGWWAQPLISWEPSGGPLRGIIHRIAAVVFIGVAVMHLISLLKSERLRRHWKALWPDRSDARGALEGLAHRLGLRSQPPKLAEHSYIEKAEYWAVVWGTVIMTATGLILWAHNLVLRWLPKVILDLATAIHFYEAVLAALAILVWHFYFVIFDPDVYPMDTAWLTGKSSRQRGTSPIVPTASSSPEVDSKEKV